MLAEKNEKKALIFLLLISLIFIIAQIIIIIHYNNYFLLGSFEKMDNDDVKYIRSAEVLLKNKTFIYRYVDKPTVYIMPGYPIFIAFFMLIFGNDLAIVAVRLFQAVLQTLSLFLIYWVGKKVFEVRVALLACLIDVFYIPEIESPGLILTEVLFKFLVLLLVYISILAVEKKDYKLYIIGGIVWTLACYVRPTIFLYPILIFMFWCLNRYTFKEMFKFAVIVMLIFSILMLPWWIRNYVVFNRFIPLTLSSGNPFLQGTYVNYNQKNEYTSYKIYDDEIKTDRSEWEVGKRRFIENFKRDPKGYIYWYTIGKTRYMWKYPFYFKNIAGISFDTADKFHDFIIYLGIYGMILSLISCFKGRALGFYLTLIIIYFNLVHLPFYTFSRYSYPAMSFMIILASYAIISLLNYIFVFLDYLMNCRRTL